MFFSPKLVLELCRTEQTAGLQSHLDRIHAARSHPGDPDVSLKIFLNPVDLVRITVHLFKRLFPQFCCAEAEASKSNFLALVQTLIQDPVEREHFFQVSICFFKQQSLNISMVRQHWYNKTDETSSI